MKGYKKLVHWLTHPRLPNEHGYAMAFWAIFMGTMMVPLMVLAWDVGRLFYARGEIQKAADAAALAAAREVDVPHDMLTGDVSPLFPEFLQVKPISAWGEAQVRIERR